MGKEGRLTRKRLVSVAPVRVFGQKVGVETSVPDVVVRECREGFGRRFWRAVSARLQCLGFTHEF